jgi:hypothetical protein
MLFLIVCFLKSLSSVFVRKLRWFWSFDLTCIGTRFSRQNFIIFWRIFLSMNSLYFSTSIGLFSKKSNPKSGGKYPKNSRWFYNFGQVKMTTFFSKFFKILITWYSNLFLVCSERASRSLHLRVICSRIFPLQREIKSKNR